MTKPFQPVLPAFTGVKDADIVKQFNADVQRFAQAAFNVATVQSSSFTCTLLSFFYPCSGTITATLPPAKDIVGKPYAFKNVGAGTVTVARNGTDTIDSATGISLGAGSSTYLLSDGISKWYSIGGTSGGGGGGGDMFGANNLTDVADAVVSLGNLSFRALGGPSPVGRNARAKIEELGISVKDFGAVGNGVADDTTAFQNAINYINGLGGGNVYVPLGRFMFTGTIELKANVNLIGLGGPGEPSGNLLTLGKASILLVTDTTTAFIKQTTGTGYVGNNKISNLVFSYPNQIAASSASAITTYPYTIQLDQGGATVENCMFYNSYDGIWVHNGKVRILNCNFGTLHYGITLDRAIDWVIIDNCLFNPYYTYGSGLTWPQNIDTTMKTNGSTAIRILRADSPMINNIGIFQWYQYGIYLDAGTEVGYTGPSYGRANNIDFDGPLTNIYAKETRSAGNGWLFTNLMMVADTSGGVKGGFYLASGGSDAPHIIATNVTFRSGGAPFWTINAGFLSLKQAYSTYSSQPGDLNGGILTAPSVPASGATITSTYPYYVCIYPNGGSVTDVAINGSATGGPRGAILLPPLGTLTLTYSSAPTWTWFTS